MIDWKAFDKTVDIEGLKKDTEDAQKGGEFEKTPYGKYEVMVKAMELKQSKKGDPMLSIQFVIVAGQYKGRYIFYNQVMKSGYGIHMAMKMLRSMEVLNDSVGFESYAQFSELVLDALEEISTEGLCFELDYRANAKNPNFDEFKINDVFGGEVLPF